MANQSVRLKEEQLRREEDKLREIEYRVQREIQLKRQELSAKEDSLKVLEARLGESLPLTHPTATCDAAMGRSSPVDVFLAVCGIRVELTSSFVRQWRLLRGRYPQEGSCALTRSVDLVPIYLDLPRPPTPSLLFHSHRTQLIHLNPPFSKCP
jgi:cell division control protein 11